MPGEKKAKEIFVITTKAESFSKLMTNTKSKRTLSKINNKRTKSGHLILELEKVSDKKKIWDKPEGKTTLSTQEKGVRITARKKSMIQNF